MTTAKNKLLLGLDIGGTKSGVCIGDGETIISSQRFPTETELGFDHTLTLFNENIGNILAKNQLTPSDISAIGVSCGGPLNARKGIVYSPPNLPEWDNIHITELLEAEYGVPCFLQNDAKACALAEWELGAGKGTKNMIFCTMGTGFGSGLILDGRLYEGAIGMAGEIGHLRLAEEGPIGFNKAGSFEGFCGGSGIANLAKMRVKKWLEEGKEISFCPTLDKLDKLTAKSVADAANAGDLHAIELYKEVGRMLGKGLSLLIDILNPEVIVIGSIFVREEGLIRESMEESIREETLGFSRDACRVVPAQLGEDLGFYASLVVAKRGLQEGSDSTTIFNPDVKAHLDDLIQRHPELGSCSESIYDSFRLIRSGYLTDNKLLICGNGGSAADAEHIVAELMKGYLKTREIPDSISEAIKEVEGENEPYLSSHLQGALQAISLTGNAALSTAYSNDVAADMVFAQLVYGYGRKGDTLLCISTSGNSANVLNAAKVAKALGLHTVGLTGATGGKLKALCEVTILAPDTRTPNIQELHQAIYHALCAMLETEFFEEK